MIIGAGFPDKKGMEKSMRDPSGWSKAHGSAATAAE